MYAYSVYGIPLAHARGLLRTHAPRRAAYTDSISLGAAVRRRVQYAVKYTVYAMHIHIHMHMHIHMHAHAHAHMRCTSSAACMCIA